MLWALFLVLHLTGLVGYTLLLRRSAFATMNRLLVAACMQTAIFVPLLFVLAFGSQPRLAFSAWEWTTLIASGVLIAVFQISTVQALRHLEASVFTIVFNIRLFLVTVLGFVFLRDLPSPLQILGGVTIFASILLLNLHKNRQFLSRPILYGLFATLMISAVVTLEKYNLQQVGFTSYMFWSQGLAVVLLWLFVLKSDVNLAALKRSANWHVALLMLLRSASGWGYTCALLYGSLAVTGYISGLSVALIVLFGIFLLGERQHIRQKLAAVAIALVGLTLILIGKL